MELRDRRDAGARSHFGLHLLTKQMAWFVQLVDSTIVFTQTNKSLEAAIYRKETWEQYITQFEYETFTDEQLKRQFQLLQTLGTAALPEEDQQIVNKH